MARLGACLLTVCLALAGSPGLTAVADAASLPTETVHVLVHFGLASSSEQRDAAARAVGGTIESFVPALGMARIAAPLERGLAVKTLIDALRSQAGVIDVESDERVHLDFAPSDPYWNTDPYVGLGQWGAKKIQLDKALDGITVQLQPVTVAVLDTGVDATHPDLAGAVIGGTTYLATNDPVCGSGVYPTGTDDNSHGTHVAGIIAARSNNGIGIVGMAQNARILPVKALDCTGSGSISDIASAIVYAVDHGARLINISLGSSSESTAMQNAVQYAVSHNVLIIAAAGNCGILSTRCLNTQNLVEYPAAYPGVLGVGATSMDDSIATFSTQGSQVGISAPGVRIVSTVPNYRTYQSDHGGTQGYAAFSGTSQATPYVTGLAALLLGIDPTLSATALAQRLRGTADDLGVTGPDQAFGAGRLNALRAAQATLPATGATFSAKYDMSGAPRSATSATSFTANVRVTNTSPATWLATGTNPIRLGYHWLDANGNVVLWDGVRTALPADLPPGGTVTVPLVVIAPPTRGQYTLRVDLVREGDSWFSAKGVAPADLSVAIGTGLGASYATTATTATLVTASPSPLAVTLINTGTRAWSAGGATPVHLAYHWLKAGTVQVWDGARAPPFVSDVQPGQTVTVQLPLQAPADLGAYTLRLDLVQEGVSWFSTEGIAPRDIAYSVTTGYAATYTPSAIPALLPGERVSVRVAVANNGVLAWSAAGPSPVHLAAHVSDMSGNTVIWDGARTSFSADVAPGANDVYSVTVDAPLAAGGYRARVDLVREGVSWFSGLGIATGDTSLLVIDDYRAQLALPATLSVSRTNSAVAVTVTNPTSALWTAKGTAPVHLSVHWYDAAGNVLVWDGPRTELASDLGPGASATVQVGVGALPAGAASLSVDLVSEGVRWFGAGAIRPVTFTP